MNDPSSRSTSAGMAAEPSRTSDQQPQRPPQDQERFSEPHAPSSSSSAPQHVQSTPLASKPPADVSAPATQRHVEPATTAAQSLVGLPTMPPPQSVEAVTRAAQRPGNPVTSGEHRTIETGTLPTYTGAQQAAFNQTGRQFVIEGIEIRPDATMEDLDVLAAKLGRPKESAAAEALLVRWSNFIRQLRRNKLKFQTVLEVLLKGTEQDKFTAEFTENGAITDKSLRRFRTLVGQVIGDEAPLPGSGMAVS